MMPRPGRPRTKPLPPGRDWANRIQDARIQAGLSQAMLGAALNKSQSTIGEYEVGKTEPDLATFNDMAEALNTTPCWLAFGDPDDRNAGPDTGFADEKEDRLFAWTIHRAAKLLTDEGLDGDLTFLTLFAKKLMRSAQNRSDDAEAKELILRAIETERAEFRQRKNEIKKNAI